MLRIIFRPVNQWVKALKHEKIEIDINKTTGENNDSLISISPINIDAYLDAPPETTLIFFSVEIHSEIYFNYAYIEMCVGLVYKLETFYCLYASKTFVK